MERFHNQPLQGESAEIAQLSSGWEGQPTSCPSTSHPGHVRVLGGGVTTYAICAHYLIDKQSPPSPHSTLVLLLSVRLARERDRYPSPSHQVHGHICRMGEVAGSQIRRLPLVSLRLELTYLSKNWVVTSHFLAVSFTVFFAEKSHVPDQGHEVFCGDVFE